MNRRNFATSLHLRGSFGGEGGQGKEFAEAGVDDFAGLGEQSFADVVVAGVELELAFFYEGLKECCEIAGVIRVGGVRHGAGEIVPADEGHAVVDEFFAATSELAIAAALGG